MSSSPGTIFAAKRRTKCPVCGLNVEPDEFVVYVTVDGRDRAIHKECANKKGIYYQMGKRFDADYKFMVEKRAKVLAKALARDMIRALAEKL